MKQFTLTEDHITLLQQANIQWCNTGYGAPRIDPKRPFGNSGVEQDLAEILDVSEVDTYDDYRTSYDPDEMRDVVETHNELDTALQVILSCQTFKPGVFTKDGYSDDWTRMTVGHGDRCPACNREISTSIASMHGRYYCRGDCSMMFWVKE